MSYISDEKNLEAMATLTEAQIKHNIQLETLPILVKRNEM